MKGLDYIESLWSFNHYLAPRPVTPLVEDMSRTASDISGKGRNDCTSVCSSYTDPSADAGKRDVALATR